MTIKQRKYVQGVVSGKSKKQSALDAGYAESTALTASQNIESDLLWDEIEQAYKQRGLTLASLVDQLKEGIQAEMPAPNWQRFRDDVDWMPDYKVRLQYIVLSFKLLNLL